MLCWHGWMLASCHPVGAVGAEQGSPIPWVPEPVAFPGTLNSLER